jgi:hypothetical protein
VPNNGRRLSWRQRFPYIHHDEKVDHKVKFYSYLLAATLLAVTPMAFALSELETNGTSGSANGPISFPDVITGNFNNDGEGVVDYFSFTGTAGVTYTFAATVTGIFGSDMLIDIEDGLGALQIATVDNNGANQGETAIFTPSSTATYYLVLFNTTGPNAAGYSVTASQAAGVNDWELY